MPERVFECLDPYRYLMLAVAMVCVVLLVAKSYGIGVEKDGFINVQKLKLAMAREKQLAQRRLEIEEMLRKTKMKLTLA